MYNIFNNSPQSKAINYKTQWITEGEGNRKSYQGEIYKEHY